MVATTKQFRTVIRPAGPLGVRARTPCSLPRRC